MKLQLQQFLRRASTTVATKGKKSVNLSAKPLSKSQPAVDISKMPQPLPVLTPLARSHPTITDAIPSMEGLLTSDKSVFCVELESELQKRLPRTIAETSQHFGGNFFVARKELIEVAWTAMKENSVVLLDGPNGSGKSVLLMQLYASMRETIKADSNRLAVYIPNVHKWTLGYFPYYPIEGTSEFKQPELALEILRLIALCNPKKVPEGLAAEIAEAHLDSYNRALPLYERTMKELKDQGKEITFFLDGANGLIDETSLSGYLDQEGKALSLKSIPLCANFLKANSVKIVGAFTHSNPSLPSQISSSFKIVNVPNYSAEELKRVLQLYSQLGHASNNKSDQFLAFKAFVSGSNGRKLYKTCEYDSIYYKN